MKYIQGDVEFNKFVLNIQNDDFCGSGVTEQWPNLMNLSGGLNLSRGLNMVGST